MKINIRTVSGNVYKKTALDIPSLVKDAKLRGHIVSDNDEYITVQSVESYWEDTTLYQSDGNKFCHSQGANSNHTKQNCHSRYSQDGTGDCIGHLDSESYSNQCHAKGTTEGVSIGTNHSEGIGKNDTIGICDSRSYAEEESHTEMTNSYSTGNSDSRQYSHAISR